MENPGAQEETPAFQNLGAPKVLRGLRKKSAGSRKRGPEALWEERRSGVLRDDTRPAHVPPGDRKKMRARQMNTWRPVALRTLDFSPAQNRAGRTRLRAWRAIARAACGIRNKQKPSTHAGKDRFAV
jgi:hypothetical protein